VKAFSFFNKSYEGEFSKLIVQFIKFGLVGLSNTAISLLIYYIFVFISKDLYLIGNTVGFIVSVLNSYYWNNKYVFNKKSGSNILPLAKTFLAYGGTFILGSVLLYFMVNTLRISELIAPIINLIITIPLNFLLNKFWAFK